MGFLRVKVLRRAPPLFFATSTVHSDLFFKLDQGLSNDIFAFLFFFFFFFCPPLVL